LEEGGVYCSVRVPMWRCRIFLCRSSRASASDGSAFIAFSQSRIRVGFGARRGGGWLVSGGTEMREGKGEGRVVRYYCKKRVGWKVCFFG